MKDLKCPQCGTSEIGSLLITNALWWCAACKIHFDDNGLVHYRREWSFYSEEYLKALEKGIWRVESK